MQGVSNGVEQMNGGLMKEGVKFHCSFCKLQSSRSAYFYTQKQDWECTKYSGNVVTSILEIQE